MIVQCDIAWSGIKMDRSNDEMCGRIWRRMRYQWERRGIFFFAVREDRLVVEDYPRERGAWLWWLWSRAVVSIARRRRCWCDSAG